MSFELFWSEDRVLRLTASDNFTLEQVQTCNQQLLEILKDVPPPVILIADLSAMSEYPKQLKGVLDASQPTINHSAISHVIFMGIKNPMVQFLATVVSSVGKKRFTVGSSHEDVTVLLNRLKATYDMA